MYYIGTKEQCEAYNNQVTEGEGYTGTTTQWASIKQHPSGSPFAIKVKSNYESEDMELVQELSSDWFPSQE